MGSSKVTIISLFCLLIFLPPAMTGQTSSTEEDINIISSILHQFKEIVGSNRAKKLYFTDYIFSKDGLAENIHTWYQIPREEYFIAAIDNSAGSLVSSLFFDPFKDGGIIFTNKKVYTRNNGRLWWATYDFLYRKELKKYYTDQVVVYRDEKTKEEAAYWVDNTEITNFELFNLLNDIAYALKNIEVKPKPKPKPKLESGISYYVTCINNTTDREILFTYKWDSDTEWKRESLAAGFRQWFSLTRDEKFYVEFDYSYNEGYQKKRYWLNRKSSKTQSCESASRYNFVSSNSTDIDIVI
ncbi:MAG: hypothetical protein P1U56_26625, partial [Saprospiraceae bacterium]|nr:hypothetical protein [Saprospiraceae bacterium]